MLCTLCTQTYVYLHDFLSMCAHHIIVPDSFTVWSNLPRLTSVRATHRTSATSAGKMSAMLITFPYFCWKGSIIVTYLFSLIGLAKKNPPGAGGKGLALAFLLKWWSQTWQQQPMGPPGQEWGMLYFACCKCLQTDHWVCQFGEFRSGRSVSLGELSLCTCRLKLQSSTDFSWSYF